MTRLIDAARRCGQLQLIPSLLDEAAKKCPSLNEQRINGNKSGKSSTPVSSEAGFYLCKALYYWYTGR